MLPELQSTYWANHSTETAMTKVLADVLLAPDSGDFIILTLIDLSAALDRVDHETSIQRLEESFSPKPGGRKKPIQIAAKWLKIGENVNWALLVRHFLVLKLRLEQ